MFSIDAFASVGVCAVHPLRPHHHRVLGPAQRQAGQLSWEAARGWGFILDFLPDNGGHYIHNIPKIALESLFLFIIQYIY